MGRKLTDNDLKGKKIGRWTIQGISHRKNKQIYVKVICDCGTKSVAPYHSNLKSGISQSCGCLSREKASERMIEKGSEELHEARNSYHIDGIGTKQLQVKKWKHNSSGYTGVSYMKDKKKWRAYIGIKGKHKHIGLFDTKEEAYQAREEKEKEIKSQLEEIKSQD